MGKKPTYEELEQRIKGLEAKALESRQTEEALQESERFLQDVFDAIKDGISVLDLNLKIVRVNSWIEEMYSKEGKFVGRKCYEIYQKRDTRCPWCPSLKTIETGKTHNAIVPYPSEENPTGWIDLSSFPLRNIEGDMVGVIEYAKDITKQKQAGEALRNSEKKYRELINGMSDTVLVIDLDANFIDVNDAAVEVLGYSKEELLSMGPQDIDTSIDVEEIKGLIEQIPTDEIQVFETTHTTKDGKTIPVEVKSTFVTYQGKQVILSIARDITERKQAEEALRNSEERLARAVQGISIPTFVIDDDHIITHCGISLVKN